MSPDERSPILPLLLANHCANAAALPLDYADVAAEKAVSGRQRVGTATLMTLGEATIGVWEISPGVCTDVEVEEFFIVLSGEASVAFSDGRPALQLRAGSVGHLAAGSATTWTVSETLRKVYVA